MRILLDANVILDILMKREPFFDDSYGALKKALATDAECFVSASAATDIFYVLKKGLKDGDAARQGMERLLQLVNIADVLGLDVQTALSSRTPDFEDAVVSSVAARYKADYIVTRNTKDFTGSPVPALSPHDFIKL